MHGIVFEIVLLPQYVTAVLCNTVKVAVGLENIYTFNTRVLRNIHKVYIQL